MKKQFKILSLAMAAVLAAGLLSGCGAAASQAASSAVSSQAASSAADSAAAITFTFSVTHADGTTEANELPAAAGETLADALVAAQAISADEAAAGFVTVVYDEATDYNKDQSWWMLVDGEGNMTAAGVADIQLAEGDSYGFVYTVG